MRNNSSVNSTESLDFIEILREFQKIPSPRTEVYFLKRKQLANKSRYEVCLDNLSYCLSAQETSSFMKKYIFKVNFSLRSPAGNYKSFGGIYYPRIARRIMRKRGSSCTEMKFLLQSMICRKWRKHFQFQLR
jgi:hypothetical protein